MESREALEALALTREEEHPGRFLWLHFNVSNASAEPWPKRHTALPDAFYESLHEAAASTRVEQAAVINEQSNRSLFILTIVTVLALPFNVIGGLFGMNVGGIPFGNDLAGFWVIVGLAATFTAAAALVARRRN